MFSMLPIIPQYKLLMCYDIKRGMNTTYYRYVMSEFVPALNEMEIYVVDAWHTAYGDYPVRQVEYVVDELHVLLDAFETERWQELEERLKSFTTAYTRKIVHYRRGFQF
jgi:hypothetical protein